MSKEYILDPETYHFSPSELYRELGDFFGPEAFVKVIATHEPQGHCWYKAIKINRQLGKIRYSIYAGVFTRGQRISEQEWPTQCFTGLISTEAFAEELLKHLMGTMNNSSVEKEGLERLKMKCLYMEKLVAAHR